MMLFQRDEMRIVLDTNVIISGFLWSGNESDILKLCVVRKLSNFTSPEILVEFERILMQVKIDQMYRTMF